MSKEILTTRMEIATETITLMSITKEAQLLKDTLLDPNINSQGTFLSSKMAPRETFASMEMEGFPSSP